MLAAVLAQGAAPQRPQRVYLWPCNVQAWRHWQCVQTQWRAGMSGATGLDYAGVRAYLDEEHLQPPERADAWEAIKACEAATLDAWADRQQKKQ